MRALESKTLFTEGGQHSLEQVGGFRQNAVRILCPPGGEQLVGLLEDLPAEGRSEFDIAKRALIGTEK